mmetsp:Transcript_18330/g.45907  ORF Transcript_18330/g.45907 Transcript_18330/m.45907 type:complete len:317 (-) Transcript_18330:18-968(-)
MRCILSHGMVMDHLEAEGLTGKKRAMRIFAVWMWRWPSESLGLAAKERRSKFNGTSHGQRGGQPCDERAARRAALERLAEPPHERQPLRARLQHFVRYGVAAKDHQCASSRLHVDVRGRPTLRRRLGPAIVEDAEAPTIFLRPSLVEVEQVAPHSKGARRPCRRVEVPLVIPAVRVVDVQPFGEESVQGLAAILVQRRAQRIDLRVQLLPHLANAGATLPAFREDEALLAPTDALVHPIERRLAHPRGREAAARAQLRDIADAVLHLLCAEEVGKDDVPGPLELGERLLWKDATRGATATQCNARRGERQQSQQHC